MSLDDESEYTNRARFKRFTGSLSVGTVGVVLVVLVVVGITIFVGAGYFDRTTDTVTVESKERVCDSGRDCKYLLFTTGGTYKVTDSIVAARFTSSDAYGKIKVCHRYELESYGWRFGLTSSYPNVTEAKDLGRVEGCEP